jgi:hypothetical protein
MQQKPLNPLMQAILRWLAQQPVAVYDFAVVADSIKQPRARVETTVRELQRRSILERKGPKGEILRGRHVYLVRADIKAEVLAAPGDPAPVAGAEHLARKSERLIAAKKARADKDAALRQAQADRAKAAAQEEADDFNARRAARRAAVIKAEAEKGARPTPTAASTAAPKPAPAPAPAAAPPAATPKAPAPKAEKPAAPPKAPKPVPPKAEIAAEAPPSNPLAAWGTSDD